MTTKDKISHLGFKSNRKSTYKKIVYIYRGEPPPDGYEDGAKADAFMRSELTRQGKVRFLRTYLNKYLTKLIKNISIILWLLLMLRLISNSF